MDSRWWLTKSATRRAEPQRRQRISDEVTKIKQLLPGAQQNFSGLSEVAGIDNR